MLASTESIDVARLLLDLLVVLAVGKLAAELAERVRVPAVLGEIVAGIVIGPSGFGLIHLTGERGTSLAILSELGVLLLLLSVGMEMDLAELGKVGGTSLAVAVVGVAVPFASGVGIGLAFGESTNTAIFFGAALTATSVGITARVFGDLRALASVEARIVLGAAVADDVLGLVILTVVVKIVTGGSVGIGTVASTLGLAVLFLVGTGVVGLLVVPRVMREIRRRATSSATLVVAAFALMLSFASLADVAKLAFIVGAFMAGLALGATDHHERLAAELGSVGNVLIPVFFLSIGINADLAAMAKPSVLGLAGAMTAIAVVGKLASALPVRSGRADRLLIGIGMIPRGEVGLIFASIGLSSGVLDDHQYGALLIVILLTTVITPPLLRLRLGKTDQTGATLLEGATSSEPEGGWLEVRAGSIELRAIPEPAWLIPIALQTAHLAAQHVPGDELLGWFTATRNEPLAWDAADHTPGLVALLGADNPRSWRLLEVTGVLERALPEVAAAMERKRADMTDMDPLGSLRFPTVDRLHELRHEVAGAGATDVLVLAAFVGDVTSDEASTTSLIAKLCAESDADRVRSLLADAQLLRARTVLPAVFDEHEAMQLATHFASRDQAHDAYLLALSTGELNDAQRDALDGHYEQIRSLLEHPELSGTEAANLVGARRIAAEHLLDDPAAIERLRFAPASFLLAHDPEELARQARLVEPLPRAGTMRVAVSPEPDPDRWKVDVACRDSTALLARMTDVLSSRGIDVVGADLATWPDGGVVVSFIVATVSRPGARDLAEALEKALHAPIQSTPRPSLSITFDNDALPWLTACTVTGPDEPGVLQAVAAALATSGAVIHSARIDSSAGEVNDRFAVSDRFNRKLDAGQMAKAAATLRDGASRRRALR